MGTDGPDGHHHVDVDRQSMSDSDVCTSFHSHVLWNVGCRLGRFASGLPFPHLQVLDWVSSSAFLREVQAELTAGEFVEKVRPCRMCNLCVCVCVRVCLCVSVCVSVRASVDPPLPLYTVP